MQHSEATTYSVVSFQLKSGCAHTIASSAREAGDCRAFGMLTPHTVRAVAASSVAFSSSSSSSARCSIEVPREAVRERESPRRRSQAPDARGSAVVGVAGRKRRRVWESRAGGVACGASEVPCSPPIKEITAVAEGSQKAEVLSARFLSCTLH